MGKIDIRKSEILKILSTHKNLNIETFVSNLNVSEATVRRTLSLLEQEGKIIRTHGGARLAPLMLPEYSFWEKADINVNQKEMIGRCATKLVESKDILFLDSGTTVLSVAKAIVQRIEAKELSNLSVVTNSIIIAEVMGNICKVFLLGGEVRLFRKDIAGPIVEKYMKMFRANKAFIGTDAISLKEGLMTTDAYTSRIDEEMVKRSSQAILVADSSKFNKYSLVSYAKLTDVDFIITDNKLPERIKREYERHGIKIVIATDESE